MSRRRIADAARSAAKRHAARAVRPLRQLSMRGMLPAALSRSYIVLQLQPPNGVHLRPELVDAAVRHRCKRRSAASELLLSRVLAEQRRAGLTDDEVLDLSVGRLRPGRAAAERLIDDLTSDGDLEFAAKLVERWSRPEPDSVAYAARHRLACSLLDDTAARAVEEAVRSAGGKTADLERTRLLTTGQHAAIVNSPNLCWSTDQIVKSSVEIGRLPEFEFGTSVPLTRPITLAVLRGDVELAVDLVAKNISSLSIDLDFVRVAHFVLSRTTPDATSAVRAELEQSGTATPSFLIRAFFDLALAGPALDIYDRTPTHRLDAHALYAVSKIHYVQRRFSEATELLRQLAGTGRHSDALKLQARILLESGDFEAALDHRRRHAQPSLLMDEVVYHCRLQRSEYQQAFDLYSPPADTLAVNRSFPNGRRQPPRPVETIDQLFVIAQSGPGDEIQMAHAFSAAQTHAKRIMATVEPRLLDLYRRSFPGIEFEPVVRRTSDLHWGFLAAEQPTRHRSTLSRLLTQESAVQARNSDRVVLMREMPAQFATARCAPQSAPFLTPDRELEKRLRERLPSDTPSVGIVWRSELNSLMRSIHYLSVSDLTPIFQLDATFVCLQHDVTQAERAELHAQLGDRIRFPTDIDLRQDLDGAAALVACLTAVVGVGTTLVELSGAVGTPTVLIQPNHFGSWRSTDESGSDFWYRDVSVATISDPTDIESCVMTAARLLQPRLEVKAP